MPEIQVRPIKFEDFEHLQALEHAFYTDYVWQMEREISDKQISIGFREVRLPRTIQVEYPKYKWPKEETEFSQIKGITAIIDDEIIGYLLIDKQAVTSNAFIRKLVVKSSLRRKGVASALILSAHDWARKNKLKHIIIEVQSKNVPAIRLVKKFGYEFCGYNDRFYANQDIALFFSRYCR
jgi:ribosomal protein S18 acetylase RimI-like enzyme